MQQNNFERPENSFPQPIEYSGSALHRLKERLGVGRREQIIIFGVILLTVIAGVLLFFRPQPETPPPAAFSPLERHVGGIEVTFTGSTDVPLERVKLYAVENYIEQASLLRVFAERLGLQPAEYSLTGNTYTNEQQTVTLTTATGQQGMVYTTSQALAPDMPTVREEIARAQAGEFLEVMGYIPSELTLLEDRTQYLTVNQTGGHEDIEEVTPTRAILIRLVYEKRLDTLPVTFGASSIETFTIEVTVNGVFRAVLPNTFLTPQSTSEFSVISIDEALNKIRQGKFSIIGTTVRVQDENDYIRFDLTEQTLQYRFDEGSRTLFPVFRFSGTALTESYQSLPITVVTEAINVQEVENNATVETAPQNTSSPE